MEARRTQRSGASDPEVAGSHTTREPLLLRPSPPPPLLCHSGLDYFILIRLIPPIEVSCSSPPLLPPPPLLLLQTRAISFQREDRMRASLRLIGEKNVKGETEKEALTAAVWGGALNEKIWASAV